MVAKSRGRGSLGQIEYQTALRHSNEDRLELRARHTVFSSLTTLLFIPLDLPPTRPPRQSPSPTAVAPKPPCNRRDPLRLRLHQHRNPKSPKSQIQWTSSPLAASSFVSRPPTKTHTSYNVNAARLLRQAICLAGGLAGACW